MTSLNDNTLTEMQRRYYLDVMGVQCWQLLQPESASPQTPATLEKEVVEQGIGEPGIAKQAIIESEIIEPEIIKQGVAGDVDKPVQHEILYRGNESADIMFVFLSASSSDTAAGELCSGEEGALLTKMLAAIKVAIESVYLTSLLPYQSSTDNTLSEDEIVQCTTRLKQQIDKVKPKVLIVLGEAAAQFLLKQKIPLDTLREQAAQSILTYESTPLFISYSPAELLQKVESKRKAWLDLQQLQKFLQK